MAELKRFIYVIRLSLITTFLVLNQHKTLSQCLVDYTTYSYFCDLDTLILEAVPVEGVGPFSFIWETGETTQSILIPLALGDYMLTMTDADGCTSIINCHIKPFPDVLFYPFNQNACEGDTVTLWLDWFRDSLPGATYLWSTGETTPTIQITDDITWSVTVTDPITGCSFEIPPNLFEFHATPTPEIVGPNILCDGQPIVLHVEGGPFGSIFWWPAELYQDTLIVTTPGEYIAWGSSLTAGYCWHQDTINITEGDINPPILIGPPALCPGQNGTIDITNSSLYIEFLWNNGETTSSILVDQPGTYIVTVTNAGGCTSTGEYIINSGPSGSITSSVIPATCGENNGSINLSASPPGSYTFIWSNGEDTEDLINISGGTYSVTVTSANGCTSTAIIDLPDNQIPISITGDIMDVTSCITNNGAIDINIVPNGTYTYLWSNGATTEDLIELPPGNYSLTVTTGINCIAFEDFVVDNLVDDPIIEPISSPATCGENNGSIDLQVTNGELPYSFLWSNGNISSELNNIPGGTYSVTVTGANGCSSSILINLPDNNIPIAISGVITPNSSCIESNGSIDITVSPPGSYSFLWSNGSTTEDIINIGAGMYELTVTLGSNCIQTENFTVINVNIPFDISGSSTPNTSCTSPNGAIDLTITPAGNYTFLWSNGGTNEDLQNLDPGNYLVTVTNSDGCSITSSFDIISSVPLIEISGIPNANTSCLDSNGSVDISVSPLGSYTFAWSNGATTEDIALLASGIYHVTVSDINNCSSSASFVVDDTATVPIIASLINLESCGTSNGSIDLTVVPTGNSFLWSNGAVTEDLQNIASGHYIVIVTDANGCTVLDTFVVDNLNTSFALSAVSIANNSCALFNGSLDLTVSPVGSYTFLWSNGETTEDLQNLAPGQYMVTVTDPFNCASSLTVTVDDHAVSPLVTTVITPAVCGQNNGIIDINVLPPSGNTFTWSNGSINEDLQNIKPGTYIVTVTGFNGCEVILNIDLPGNNSMITVNGNAYPNVSCITPNGSVDINVEPAGVFTFLWSNGSAVEDLQNLSPGIYTVTVTDASGCSGSNSFTIDDSTSNPVISTIITPSTCNQNNGSIILSVSSSGPNSFLWSNGSTNKDLVNVFPGHYIVTVTDIQGCSEMASMEIPDTTISFSMDANVVDNNSCMFSNGAIDLHFSPAGTFTFTWSNGASSEDLSGLAPGNYSVTVTDNSGCSSIQIFTIKNNTSLPILSEFITNATCGEKNAVIDLTVIPPEGNQFLWSTGDTIEDMDFIQGGNYSVTVTDLNGCSTSLAFSIPFSDSINVHIDADLSALNNGIVTAALQLNVPVSSIDTIIWLPDGLFSCHQRVCVEQTFTLIQQIEMMVMVIDTNGCIGQANLVLDIDKEHKVYIPNVITANGDGINDRFTVFANKEVKEVVELQIFDRWGNCVFVNETFPPNEPGYGWDGEFNGQPMNPDVFAYWAKVRFSDGNEQLFKGDLTLLR